MARGESGELTRPESTDLTRRDDEAGAPEEMSDAERILQIRESMERSRRQIAENVDQLRVEMSEAVDWRKWVRRHPWEAVGLAAGAGFLLGFR